MNSDQIIVAVNFQRIRVLAKAEMPGQIPAAYDEQTDDQAGQIVVEAFTEYLVLENKNQDGQPDHAGNHQLERAGRKAAYAGQQGREGLTMFELDGDSGRLQHIDAECAKDAFQRHQCGKPQINEHDDRSQVAASDAHQRPVGATGGERHADAEAQSADDISKPRKVVAGI